jgi:hypothetical protein
MSRLLAYHLAEGVFAQRTFGGEEGPQQGIYILPFSETVAGFLKLVELCKGLVVDP